MQVRAVVFLLLPSILFFCICSSSDIPILCSTPCWSIFIRSSYCVIDTQYVLFFPQVIRLKLITPSGGVQELTPQEDGAAFHLARVGLGALGVVAEVTLQCVKAHRLLERTQVREDRPSHPYLFIGYSSLFF
jgi:hypothetical protein